MNYWVNLQGHPEDRHRTVKILLPCWEKERSKRRCFAWNSDKEAREMILSQKRNIPTIPLSITPPWLFPAVRIDFDMLELMKDPGNIVAVVEDRLQNVYQAFVPVYTDGSKDPNTGRTSQVTYVTMVPRMGNETLRPLGVATGNALSVTRSEDTYEKTPPVGRRQPMTSLPACHNISAAGRIHHQLLRLKLASEAWSKA